MRRGGWYRWGVLAIRRAALPAGYPNIAGCLSHFDRVQQAPGKKAQASASWDEALAILRKVVPQGFAALARTLGRSGTGCVQSRDASAALPELEEAVSMGGKFLAAADQYLKDSRESLDECTALLAGGAQPAKPDAKGGG